MFVEQHVEPSFLLRRPHYAFEDEKRTAILEGKLDRNPLVIVCRGKQSKGVQAASKR
jgi:hypothetical protein